MTLQETQETNEDQDPKPPTSYIVDTSQTLVLTVPEVARKLGLSVRAAYSAAERGDLPGLLPRIGKRLLVSKYLLDKYLKGEWGQDGQ